MLFKDLAALNITADRQAILQNLLDYLQSKINKQEAIHLVFICTHNSRRSHLTQIWAQAMAHHFKIPKLTSYSSGTEATALYPTVISSLQNQGFQIETIATGNNPVYSIKFAENEHPIIGFSKTLYHTFNPKNNFAAIMTCSQADEGCPFIAGAEKRIPITYEDPKIADNTPLETEKYKERSLQIASEMYYVFSQLKTYNE